MKTAEQKAMLWIRNHSTSCWNADKSFGRDCEIYSRVVGYMRPVRAWNDAKRQEWQLRQYYDVPCEERLTAMESRYAKASDR